MNFLQFLNFFLNFADYSVKAQDLEIIVLQRLAFALYKQSNCVYSLTHEEVSESIGFLESLLFYPYLCVILNHLSLKGMMPLCLILRSDITTQLGTVLLYMHYSNLVTFKKILVRVSVAIIVDFHIFFSDKQTCSYLLLPYGVLFTDGFNQHYGCMARFSNQFRCHLGTLWKESDFSKCSAPRSSH